MPYVKFEKYFDGRTCLVGGMRIGMYKGALAFIETSATGAINRILLSDCTHLYGESLWSVDKKDIEIYVEECPLPPDDTAVKEKQRIIDEQWRKINDLLAEQDENKRGKIIAERTLKEKQERHNAQLRAVFYMLEELESIGTHREKAIVINHIRRCIHKYLKNDGLDQYGCPDDLPF